MPSGNFKEQWLFNFFFYGSDIAFDFQNVFNSKMSIQYIFDDLTFPPEAQTYGWGLGDEYLFSHMLKNLENQTEPFFSYALTLTNHHPFDVPDEYERYGTDTEQSKFYNAVFYSTTQLEKFITNAAEKSWFKNTMFIITADTSINKKTEFGHNQKIINKISKSNRSKNELKSWIDRSSIPLLFLFGDDFDEVDTLNILGGQIDLVPTILDGLKLSGDYPWAGKSLLQSERTVFL